MKPSEKEVSDILKAYPKGMSKDQFYKVAHISKATALYLLQSGLVPCNDSGKQTRRYRIKTEDVLAYLREREVDPYKHEPPTGWYSARSSRRKPEDPIEARLKTLDDNQRILLKDNPYYYYMFHFVGQKEGSILVDGISVDTNNSLNRDINDVMEYDLSRHAIINFVGKERPLLSVDRKSCISMPSIADELEQLKAKFIIQLTNIICNHVKIEEIDVDDDLVSTILNITTTLFPSLADKIFTQLCETSLSDAPIPSYLKLNEKATIKALISSTSFALKDVDFRKYEEVYRRIILGKLIDVKTIEVEEANLTVQGANYQELPLERFRIFEKEASLSSVVIKADKWEGRLKEYDLASNLWPIVNPLLFDALHNEWCDNMVSMHCKQVENVGNGIQGIAQLNPTLINPKYGIGVENRARFRQKRVLVSNPDSIENNYWLFELSNYNRDVIDGKKKGSSLFVFIAPRDLSAEETERLKEFEQNDPEFVRGVKEGWSILFISNQEYVIMPGIVTKAEIISKIPESVKNKNPDFTYYNTDGSILYK